MRRVCSPSSVVGFAALLLVGSILACTQASEGNVVTITAGQRFQPQELKVSAGDTVRFVSEAPDAHTVTADQKSLPDGGRYFASGGFESEEAARDGVADGLLTEGETYSVTFDTPGTYRYLCIPHEAQGMVGSIVVMP